MSLATTYGGALAKPNPPTLSEMPVPVNNPVGTKAVSPTSNLKPANTSLPSNQIAPKDLSGTYGRTADGTIYNKNSQTKFATPADFFKDSGLTSFDNLKFDSAYAPNGKETIYGQQAAPANLTVAPTLPTTTPAATATTANNTNQPYTPPNQGTTGVSQGGIIGNLIGIANNESPQVTQARDDLKKLTENYATQTANIEGSPIDLSLATGQQGVLSRLFAAKQGAAQTALSSALTSQGQSISANQAAGGLNAPIVTAYGQQQISPSQPTAGATTSGAGNIGQVVGQRLGADGKTQEFYNTQTGQGFANPQQLADFINQQVPGANANAQNVFQVLEQLKTQQSGNGGNSNLNPISNVGSIASQVISGQISPSQAYAMGGNVANWSTLLNQALQQASPGFDQSAAQARYDSNQSVQNSQAQQVASYKSAQQQAQNLTVQFKDLIDTYNLNPSDITVANGVVQFVGNLTSDSRYQTMSNYINDIIATYAQVLGSGGQATNYKLQLAESFVNSLASGQSIKSSLDSVDQQASAKIAGVQTPSTTNTGTNNGNSGVSEGSTAAGGALVFRNGKWVVN